ncbi:MAG: TetR/AcrR family transcriptional regulator [Kordiimonas sp.]
MPRPGRRDHIIEVAIELFCENGFHATGVDTIMRTAGVSKKTLYNHFRSKDELILASLQQHDGVFRNNFMRSVEQLADTPRERLLAIFDSARTWFDGQNFFGCMFVNVIGEYSDPTNPVREVSRNFKQMLRRYIYELSRQAGAENPDELADEIAILLEGAIVTAQVSGTSGGAKTAKRIAAQLLDTHLPK